jgi:hypothetical protein
MPYDFLNTTTVEPELEEQQRLMDLFTSQAAAQQSSNNPEDLQEIQDQDVNDLEEIDESHNADEDENEEISDSDADKMATDTHDFENEDMDATDYQLIGYLMGDSGTQTTPQRQYGGGSLASAGTVYGNEGNNWLKDRVNSIKFQTVNSKMSRYQLPQQKAEDNDYQAIHGQATNFIQNDPIAKKLGINVAERGGAYSTNYQNGGGYQFGGKYSMPSAQPFMRRQTGGSTLFADNEATLRQGLNNNNYQRAVLKLAGTNTIRGLDNNQPVAVSDGSKYKVLHGPKDTAQFKGNVYEKRL